MLKARARVSCMFTLLYASQVVPNAFAVLNKLEWINFITMGVFASKETPSTTVAFSQIKTFIRRHAY